MVIIDRFEGQYAVCEEESGDFRNIPRAFLPADCREGDCLILGIGGDWQVDQAATARQRQKTLELMRRLTH